VRSANRIVIAILLFVASSVYVQGQPKTAGAHLQEELMKLQRAQDDAEEKKDVVALDRILSENFIFTSPSGSLTNKKKFLEEVKADSSETETSISYDEIRTFDYGRTAVVNYLLMVKGREKDGKDFTNRYRNTVVWAKERGRWRMAAIHVSRIRP
jgi:ketosteroid isomerase-like protein